MPVGKALTDAEALTELRRVIADLPVSRRAAGLVEDECKKLGIRLSYRRIKRLVEQHKLFEIIAVPASAQLIALADHRKASETVRAFTAADTLGKLEALANTLLDKLEASVPGVVVENANQLATLVGSTGNLVKIIASARETLAMIGEDRAPDGSVAGSGGYLDAKSVFERYGPRSRDADEDFPS